MLEMGQTCAPWRALWIGVMPEMNSEMKDSLVPLDKTCVDGPQVLTMIAKVES